MNTILRSALMGIFTLFLAAPATFADVTLKDGSVLSEKPYFVVTYVEAEPNATAKVAALIKAQVERSRGETGSIRMEGLQQPGRQNQFLLLEAWEDKASRDTHAATLANTTFRKDLQSLLYSPYDERIHVGLDASNPAGLVAPTKDTVYVVTHVDIIPPEQFAPCKRQVSEAGPCGNDLVKSLVQDSRGHTGNQRFDALTQANRPNHMTVVEMWNSSANQEAHTVSADVRNFRDGLAGVKPGSGVPSDPLFLLNPLTGSLYDESLYAVIQ